MTPSAILSRAESLGLTITPDGEYLRIRGPRNAIEEITPLVKAHKPAILAAMYMPSNEPENSRSSLKADRLGKGSHPLSSSQKSPYTLDSLIQRAATFYEYSAEDYALIEALKRNDPDGLHLALKTDPLCHFYLNKELS
jgi:hypothetical protein